MSKTPCIAACKNNGGLCSGCNRTMAELRSWKHLEDEQKEQIMAELDGSVFTHQCPRCGKNTYCGVQDDKSHCWCFDIEKREGIETHDSQSCLCRQCMNELYQ